MTDKTNELRELLDERGVKYIPDDGQCARETIWKPSYDVTAAYVDFGGGNDATHFEITYWDLSPEQAVDVVEVVRCMDCAYSRPAEEDAVYYCDKDTFGLMGGSAYCSLGKRKGESR